MSTRQRTDWPRLERATADLDPPFGVVDMVALVDNAEDMRRRAAGTRIRLASKSIRCRDVLALVHEMPGFGSVLSYSLAEALWLADEFDDIVVAYPSVDRAALRRLGADQTARERITVMIDSTAHLDFIDSAVGAADSLGDSPIRVCLDVDASLRLAGDRVHLGVRRSPVRTPRDATVLAAQVTGRRGFRLVGLMSYEAQIAGLGDNPGGNPAKALAIRAIQRSSATELADRRAAVVEAVNQVAPLEFVNGGGTGSLHLTHRESAVTEVAAGSGLYGPTLFDAYRSFIPRPAAFFALPVTRRPAPHIATCFSGGWIASGPAGRERLPTPVHPTGLRLLRDEGAGEVQTPVQGTAADSLRVGDRVWFRHAKAGELCERLDTLQLVHADGAVTPALTYRGAGRNFG